MDRIKRSRFTIAEREIEDQDNLDEDYLVLEDKSQVFVKDNQQWKLIEVQNNQNHSNQEDKNNEDIDLIRDKQNQSFQNTASLDSAVEFKRKHSEKSLEKLQNNSDFEDKRCFKIKLISKINSMLCESLEEFFQLDSELLNQMVEFDQATNKFIEDQLEQIKFLQYENSVLEKKKIQQRKNGNHF